MNEKGRRVNESMSKPRVQFIDKIGARVHFCHEAALVRVTGGANRLRVCRVGDGDSHDPGIVCLDNRELVEGLVGCPTCDRFVYHGDGHYAFDREKMREYANRINGYYGGLESAVQNITPILGLFATGYYVVADMEQYPCAQRWQGSDTVWDFLSAFSWHAFDSWNQFLAGWPEPEYHNTPVFLWASQSPLCMDWERVEHYKPMLESDPVRAPRPVVLYMNGGLSLVLDGHHKVAAASVLGRPIRCTMIFPVKDSRAVHFALKAGKRLFLNAVGRLLGRYDNGEYYCDFCTHFDKWSCAPYLTSGDGRYLSDVLCFTTAEERVSKSKYMSEMRKLKRLGFDLRDGSNEFCRRYVPAVVDLPSADELRCGTYVDLGHVREQVDSVIGMREKLNELRSSGDKIRKSYYDSISVALFDLLNYKALFPQSKWISEKEEEKIRNYIVDDPMLYYDYEKFLGGHKDVYDQRDLHIGVDYC